MTTLIKETEHHTIDEHGTITNTKTGNIKKQWIGANGYYHVDIQENGKAKKYALHRLLATTFIPNPENKRTVNHKDGNKLNNNLSNLEWATDSENMQHAHNNGLQPYTRNYTLKEYESILQEQFLKGQTITEISKVCNQSLTQLSYHLREAAERLNILEQYEIELKIQKNNRAKQSGMNQRKHINLQMIDMLTGSVVKTFTCVSDARDYLKVKSAGPISNVLAGRQKTAYGHFWISA